MPDPLSVAELLVMLVVVVVRAVGADGAQQKL